MPATVDVLPPYAAADVAMTLHMADHVYDPRNPPEFLIRPSYRAWKCYICHKVWRNRATCKECT